MCAFALLFDLDLSIGKLRVGVFNPHSSTEEELLVHTAGWTPHALPIKTTGTLKFLGVVFDITGPQVTQKGLTKHRLQRACVIMAVQRSIDSVTLTASICSLARASYTATHTPWSDKDVTSLDTPLNQLHRRTSKNAPTFPTALLYIPQSQGGMGIPRLSDCFIRQKWAITQRLILAGGRPADAAQGLLSRAARRSGGEAHPSIGGFIGPTIGPATWASALGSYRFSSPLRPHHGTYHSVLDEFFFFFE